MAKTQPLPFQPMPPRLNGNDAIATEREVTLDETTDTALPDDFAEMLAADDVPASAHTEELLDLEQFRADLTEDPLDSVADKPVLKRIQVRKPGKREWVTVHPSSEFSMVVVTLDYDSGESRTTYLVAGRLLQEEMVRDFGAKRERLHLALDWTQKPFFWRVGLPRWDGTLNPWTQSAEDAIEEARKGWIRVASHMGQQEYLITRAKPDKIPPPKWPEMSFEDLARLAFRDKMLKEGNPLLARLRYGG